MEIKIERLDLGKLVRQYEQQSLKSAIQKIVDEGAEEITIAVHSAFDLLISQMPQAAKEAYVRNAGEYLKFCNENGIKILHFRDMCNRDELPVSPSSLEYTTTEQPLGSSAQPKGLLNILNDEIEPSLFAKFGIKADYEIPTFPNIGVPLDLVSQYLEQEATYGIFAPAFYTRGNTIKIVNGIGCFTESDACFIHGIAVMDRIAQKEIRIIQECALPKTLSQFDIVQAYSSRYGLSKEKIKLYSFSHCKSLPSDT